MGWSCASSWPQSSVCSPVVRRAFVWDLRATVGARHRWVLVGHKAAFRADSRQPAGGVAPLVG